MKCEINLMGFQRFDSGTKCKQNEPQKKFRFVMRIPQIIQFLTHLKQYLTQIATMWYAKAC